MPRVTLQQIADEARVHVSSVSLALRNHPRIPEDTRARIRAIAEKLGYQPDPVLGALVAYRQSRRSPEFAGVLGWMDVWPEEGGARQHFPEQWKGAKQRAQTHGWLLEEFHMPPGQFTPKRSAQILRQRNIQGLIIPPMPRPHYHMEFEWEHFSVVSTSHSLVSPHVHHVTPDGLENMRLCLHTLHARGYRRIALILSRETNERGRRNFSAALVDDQLYGTRCKITAPLFYGKFPSAPELKIWLKRHRPDAIITDNPQWLLERLSKLGISVPDDIGIAGTSVWERPEFAGINENYIQLAATAVDFVTGMIHRNERGIPQTPLDVRVPGYWNEAPTLRAAPV